MPEKVILCPNGHGIMDLFDEDRPIIFRGKMIIIPVEGFVCSECKIEVGIIDQAVEKMDFKWTDRRRVIVFWKEIQKNGR